MRIGFKTSQTNVDWPTLLVILPAASGPDGLRRVVHEVVEPLRERVG